MFARRRIIRHTSARVTGLSVSSPVRPRAAERKRGDLAVLAAGGLDVGVKLWWHGISWRLSHADEPTGACPSDSSPRHGWRQPGQSAQRRTSPRKSAPRSCRPTTVDVSMLSSSLRVSADVSTGVLPRQLIEPFMLAPIEEPLAGNAGVLDRNGEEFKEAAQPGRRRRRRSPAHDATRPPARDHAPPIGA